MVLYYYPILEGNSKNKIYHYVSKVENFFKNT